MSYFLCGSNLSWFDERDNQGSIFLLAHTDIGLQPITARSSFAWFVEAPV